MNCYPRVVKSEGSPEAQKLIEELMEPCDSEWRGLGVIPGSGLVLRKEWEAFDARKKVCSAADPGQAKSGLSLWGCASGKMQAIRL